jgi:hypothetical protein
MKTQNDLNQEFLQQAAALMPVAKGCITKRKDGYLFFHKKGGKVHGMHIRPELVCYLRTAIANGKKLQALVSENGAKLVQLYRQEIVPTRKVGRKKKIDISTAPKRKRGRPKKIIYHFG